MIVCSRSSALNCLLKLVGRTRLFTRIKLSSMAPGKSGHLVLGFSQRPQQTCALCSDPRLIRRWEEGAKQFRDDVAVNPADTEEAIWAFMCEARLWGPQRARDQFLEVRRALPVLVSAG